MTARAPWTRHLPFWVMLAGAAVLNATLGGPGGLAAIRDLLPDPSLSPRLGLLFAVLWLGYLGVALQTEPPSPGVVAAYVLALAAIFVAMPASFSIDLLDYIRRGRILSVYGANPHLTAASQFPHDPFHSDVGWTFLATPYGPAFTLLSAALTRVAGDAALANVLAFKAALTAAYLLSWALVRSLGASPAAAVLYAANPFVLLEVLANGHNDVFPAAAALASLACTRHRRPLAAAALLAVAFCFKAPFVALVPVWLHYAVFGRDSPEDARRHVLLGLAVMALVTGILWLPFFESTSVLHVYRLHAGLETKWSLAALLGRALAGAGIGSAAAVARLACLGLGLALLVPSIRRATTWATYLGATCMVLLVVPLVGMSWLLPWYFIWPLSVWPLLEGAVSRPAVLALTAAGLAHYAQHSYLGFDSSPTENLILGLSSIAPVFLALIWSAARQRRHASPAAGAPG